MRAIELRQLRYFVLVAEELHFGKAAELAFVTQPALSQQISKLEEHMGVQLLTRDRRHVALTPAGQIVRDGAAKIFSTLDSTLRLARQASEHEEFKIAIGMVEYTNLPFVPPALIQLQALYPDLKIDRYEMNGAKQLESLAKGEIDVGFGVLVSAIPPEAQLEAKPLLTAGWTLLMPEKHRLATLTRLRIEDLASERIIMFSREVNPPLYDQVLVQCRAAGFVPSFVYETTQMQVGISLVKQGLGVMLGAQYVFNSLPEGLLQRPVDGLSKLTVNAFSRRSESRPLLLDFLELVSEAAKRTAFTLSLIDAESAV